MDIQPPQGRGCASCWRRSAVPTARGDAAWPPPMPAQAHPPRSAGSATAIAGALQRAGLRPTTLQRSPRCWSPWRAADAWCSQFHASSAAAPSRSSSPRSASPASAVQRVRRDARRGRLRTPTGELYDEGAGPDLGPGPARGSRLGGVLPWRAVLPWGGSREPRGAHRLRADPRGVSNRGARGDRGGGVPSSGACRCSWRDPAERHRAVVGVTAERPGITLVLVVVGCALTVATRLQAVARELRERG
ncbi:hypothetical protein QJS66_13180 [Kocuria rhizophila]|nr:hypothetical protein QJS66_13180 [Kocuria rhizophila]